MTVIMERLKPYKEIKAELIPLFPWNKQVIDKNGLVRKKGKMPIYSNWVKRKIDIKETLERCKKGYNVGYRIPKGEMVIDVDPRNFKEGLNSLDIIAEKLDMSIDEMFEFFPTVRTGGGGYHFYCHIPQDIYCRETLKEIPGVEFKTLGRQVVAAGSKHPDGEYYNWDDDHFCPELKDRPMLPKKFLKLLERKAPAVQIGMGVISTEELYALLEQLPVEKYRDHDEWFKIMCASHHATGGAGIEEFLHWSLSDKLFQDHESLIKTRWDSLSEKQLNITINTLYKEVLSFGGNTAVAKANKDFADYADIKQDFETDDFMDEMDDLPDPARDIDHGVTDDIEDLFSSPELEQSYKAGVALEICKSLSMHSSEEEIIKAIRASLQAGAIEQIKCFKILQKEIGITKGELNEIIRQVKEQITEDLGRALAEKTLEIKFHNGKGLVFNNNAQFWSFNGKFWSPITKQYVGKEITKMLDKIRKRTDIAVKENTLVTEAINIMERITAVNDDILRLRKKPYPVINCQNGELWMKSNGQVRLKPHNPKSYLMHVLNVDYLPGAECPIFDSAIRRTFSGFKDCEDMVRHFEEFMGYTLHPDKRPAQWWLLKGPGGDGKTTLLRILSSLLGDAVQPDDISRYKTGADKHASAELIGKLLLYDDDLNKDTMLPDGVLKKLSEDGELTANPKNVQGFKFIKVCTVALLSNGYPKTKDLSRGFRRRAQVIPFNKAFHEEGAIVDLAERIVKEELSGVLNKALDGLRRVKERGGFRQPVSCVMAKKEWLHESNTIALFTDEALERISCDDEFDDREHSETLTDLYAVYGEFCHNYGVKRVETKQQFRSTLEDMDFVYGVGGGNKKVFFGVKIRENFSSAQEDFDDLEFDDLDFD